MTKRGTCSSPECRQRSFADSPYCLHHLPDRQTVEARRLEQIRSETVLRDLVVPLLTLENVDFSHKTLIDCDFHGAVFNNCRFTETNFTFCLFDHAAFIQCQFHESKLLESILACACLQDTEFSVSDIIQCNFNGCQTINSRFMACDLMYSRFLSIRGEGLTYEDCNLKGVHFSLPVPAWMTFSYSNKEDAIYL